ncbi:MAG: hypothetical protein II978_08435 [Clostridia bacterium]|nr:hypothetical protein [Clostridia bacterium]
MDVFLEYLLEKKSTMTDVLKKLGVVLAAFVLMIIVINILAMFGPFVTSYMPLFLAGIVYAAYIVMRNFNLEYEYIFTNGDLDIDIIKSRKVRKRLTNLNTKQIEIMARKDNDVYKRDFESEAIAKKYDAVYNPSKGDIFCVIYNVDGVRSMLTFQPPEKLAEAMKKMNPRAVILD